MYFKKTSFGKGKKKRKNPRLVKSRENDKIIKKQLTRIKVIVVN